MNEFFLLLVFLFISLLVFRLQAALARLDDAQAEIDSIFERHRQGDA